ncbi:hypothetical protein LX36DRAFT_427782 [Colletotrichum falcatum]|nr:hypothetical protein LX36DRAFT_427782 [Colletotrichum falcatum]
MFSHIINFLAPLPCPAPIVCNPQGYCIGLDAIDRHGRYNRDPDDRLGRARYMAVDQQDRLHTNRMHLLEEQSQDTQALQAEYDVAVCEVLDQYNIDIRSLRRDPRSNGNTLKARRLVKKAETKIKSIEKRRLHNQTWLNVWYEKRANQYMHLLRSEWLASDYCSGYPFWGDEMAASVQL